MLYAILETIPPMHHRGSIFLSMLSLCYCEPFCCLSLTPTSVRLSKAKCFSREAVSLPSSYLKAMNELIKINSGDAAVCLLNLPTPPKDVCFYQRIQKSSCSHVSYSISDFSTVFNNISSVN